MFIDTIHEEGVICSSSRPNLSLVAFNGNQRYRVVKGFMTSMSMSYSRPPLFYSPDNDRGYFVRYYTATLDISINIPQGGLIVDTYDPFQPYPIGSKTVDECTVDELLFAIQHKLGIIKP